MTPTRTMEPRTLTDPDPPEDASRGRPVWPGLAFGTVALGVALLAPAGVAAMPGGSVLVAVGILTGLVTLLRAGLARDPEVPAATWVVTLAPWLGVPFLVLRWAGRAGVGLPPWMGVSLVPHGLVLGAVLLVLIMWPHRVRAVATAGWVALPVLYVLNVFTPAPPGVWALLILTTALGGILIAIGVQRYAGRRVGGSWSAYALPVALVAAGAQLLDGVVTWLAVNDPLSLTSGGFTEQVFLSRILLETTGIGYPLVKWSLALAAIYALEVRGGPDASRDRMGHVLTYLAVIYLGLQPGLFSSLQVVS